MANSDETQEIGPNLDTDDQEMEEEEGQIGHVGSLPPDPNREEAQVNMQLGATLPTQMIPLPFELGTVGLPTVGLRIDHIQLIFRLFIHAIPHWLFQSIIIASLLGVQGIEIHRRVARNTPNDIHYDSIDELIALPPPIVFGATTMVVEDEEQNNLTNILNPAATDTTPDQQTTNEPRVQQSPPISSHTTTHSSQNEQSHIEPFSNEPVPSHRILSPPGTPMPDLIPIVEQQPTYSQPSNEVDDENITEIQEANTDASMNMESSSNVNQTGDNQTNLTKRPRSLEEDDDDDSKSNSKRQCRH